MLLKIKNNKMNDKEEQILNNIKIVTEGIQKDIGLDNSFSSWKNTEKGLRFIKNDTQKFYLGLKMWINIVEDQILHCNDYSLLKSVVNNYKWIENFLQIKDSV